MIPITVAIPALLRWRQGSRVFKRLGIETEPNRCGFIGYVLIYQVIASAASLWGYVQFVVGSNRRW